MGLEFQDEDGAHPEAPPPYDESVAERVAAARPWQDAQRRSQECWSRGSAPALTTYPHGRQLLIINTGRDCGRRSHTSDPTRELAVGPCEASAIPSMCLAYKGRVGQQASISKSSQPPQPRKLLDCKGFVVRALLHRQPFCSSPTLLPSPDRPQGERDAVWTPCTFLDCITNTHKGKRQAGHQRSLSFKLWVLLAGFIVILIYRTASGMVIHTL